MIRVKICGLTNLSDALTAIRYGADAVGFLVGQTHNSTSHFIEPEKAKDIIRHLPPFCSTVLVTHLSKPDEIIDLASIIGVSTVQLHGDTTPEEAEHIRLAMPHLKTYKVVHVFDETAIEEARSYERSVDGIILDTAVKETGQIGGTGMLHDWSVSRKLVASISLPVILAGGLNADNIEDAIRTVRPFGVDVNSGVTNRDGSKNLSLLKKFIQKAKHLKASGSEA